MGSFTDFLKKLGGKDYDPGRQYITAILLAGGVGSRMQDTDGKTKQMIELDGIPIIQRTIAVFENSPAIRDIVLVVREEEMAQYAEMKEKYGWKKVVKTVKGGEERQDSAIAGFKAINDKTDVVLIHDGARCLVSEEIIDRVARAAMVHGAAIAAEKATATVKKVDDRGFIEETVDRNYVYLAQTPQGFKTEVYRAAVYLTLSKSNLSVTDDAMFLENVDLPVKIVECDGDNLKITTKRDLYVARAILAEREEKRLLEEVRSAEQRASDRKARKEAREI